MKRTSSTSAPIVVTIPVSMVIVINLEIPEVVDRKTVLFFALKSYNTVTFSVEIL